MVLVETEPQEFSLLLFVVQKWNLSLCNEMWN